MKGWAGRVLRVDLTRGVAADEPLDPAAARDYIGGRGLGIYYLNREMDPQVDPLSPDNMLCLFTGPLTGTRAATGARYMITTKGPLNGALTASNAGGRFPTELKRAGYDGIIVTGRASEPTYIYISESGPELRSASHLWSSSPTEPWSPRTSRCAPSASLSTRTRPRAPTTPSRNSGKPGSGSSARHSRKPSALWSFRLM